MTAGLVWSLAVPVLAQSKKNVKAEEKAAPSLAHQVRHQLQRLPYASVFDFVSFSLEDGKVTLTGQVVRPTLRADAEAAVKSLEGVLGVVNNIEVLPPSPSDDELRRAVYRAIYEDPALWRYAVHPDPAVHIIVKNGNVALEGMVDSLGDKNMAEMRAGAVTNVVGVKNNLLVQPKASPAQ